MQTYISDSNKLVAHIVWENDVKALLKRKPDKQKTMLMEIQKIIEHEMQEIEAFPSAHSGKRDINYIKNDVDGLIVL